MQTQTQAEHRILDDGEFYVVLESTQSPDVAGGFLERRCLVSPSTPRGFECIGAFTKQIDGQWEARIATAFDPTYGSECTVVAKNAGRSSAIVALWKAKFEALSGHHTL